MSCSVHLNESVSAGLEALVSFVKLEDVLAYWSVSMLPPTPLLHYFLDDVDE